MKSTGEIQRLKKEVKEVKVKVKEGNEFLVEEWKWSGKSGVGRVEWEEWKNGLTLDELVFPFIR